MLAVLISHWVGIPDSTAQRQDSPSTGPLPALTQLRKFLLVFGPTYRCVDSKHQKHWGSEKCVKMNEEKQSQALKAKW